MIRQRPRSKRLRKVDVVKPEIKTIRREVAQPGHIEAYERTPIMARIPGYVLKWNVDIGDLVEKDKTILAELSVPDMESELKLKKEQVKQARRGAGPRQGTGGHGQVPCPGSD